MDELVTKDGKVVAPLTAEEIAAWREGHEYREAVGLISSKWRKAVIAFAALLAAGAVVWSVAIEPVIKRFGAD